MEQLRRLMTKVTVRPGEGYVDLVVEGALTAVTMVMPSGVGLWRTGALSKGAGQGLLCVGGCVAGWADRVGQD